MRIVLTDVDGTLVDYHNRLPSSAVDAIRAARAAGHRVYLSTGRSKAEVYPNLWEIGLDGMIGGNGSYVEDGETVVLDQHLAADDTRAIVDWLHSRGLEFYLEANSGLYGSEGFAEAARPVVAAYRRSKGDPDADNATADSVFPGMIYGADLYRDDINKISFILHSYDDHLDSAAEFPHLTAGTWGGRGASALFGDLGPVVTKAGAIEALLAHLGADRADTIGIGDAAIDIPMLQFCAVGVAMGNAPDDVKAVADLVTDDVEHDGFANAFVALGLA